MTPFDALNTILTNANFKSPLDQRLAITGQEPMLPGTFKIATAGAATIAAVGLAVAEIWRERSGQEQNIGINLQAAAAAMRDHHYFNIISQPKPDLWSPISGFYQTGDDRWIQLHCNFPHHRDGVLKTLNCANNHDEVVKAIKQWPGQKLEDTLAQKQMCAAIVRSPEEWQQHPQAQAIATLPLFEITKIADSQPKPLIKAERPLSGVRVLDLTRVISGPIGARTLAEYGADVLRVSSPDLPAISSLVMSTGFGKRNTYMDITQQPDRQQLLNLTKNADVFLQAYHPGGVAGHGFAPETLAKVRPGLIYVSLSAYGRCGPWSNRRGFDSLVQSASGLAHENGDGKTPKHLPAQVLDYATGYLIAFGTMVALLRRAHEGGSYHVQCSLAQTGQWFNQLGRVTHPDFEKTLPREDIKDLLEFANSPFGKLEHLGPVLELSQTPGRWASPPAPLGTDDPRWLT